MNWRMNHPQTQPARPDHHGKKGRPYPPSATSIATYFQQSCPTCGRPLQVPVEHLGHRVFCTHCRCAFVSCDEALGHHDGADGGRCSVLERAERLLALVDSSRRRRRAYRA